MIAEYNLQQHFVAVVGISSLVAVEELIETAYIVYYYSETLFVVNFGALNLGKLFFQK